MEDKFIIQRRRVATVTVPLDAIRASSLSFKARGILTFLLSFPEEVSLSQADIIAASPDGRDKVRSGLLELANAGYLHSRRQRDRGKLAGSEWHVFDVPTPREIVFPEEAESCGKTNVGFSNVGKTNVGKTYVGKTNVGKTNVGKPDLGENPSTPTPEDVESDIDPEKCKHTNSGGDAISAGSDTRLIYNTISSIIPAGSSNTEEEIKNTTNVVEQTVCATRQRAKPKFTEQQQPMADYYSAWVKKRGGGEVNWTDKNTACFKATCVLLGKSAEELELTGEQLLRGLLESGYGWLATYYQDCLMKPSRFHSEYSVIASRVVSRVKEDRERKAKQAQTQQPEETTPATPAQTQAARMNAAYLSAWNDWHKLYGEPDKCKDGRSSKLNEGQLADAKRMFESYKNGRFTLTYYDVYKIHKEPRVL